MATPENTAHLLATAPVVVGVDGSAGSDLAVRWAAEVAGRRGRTLHLLHGLDIASLRSTMGSYDALVPSVMEMARTRAVATVDAARRLATEVAPGLQVTTEVSDASPGRLLTHLSKSAYLVVLGATGNAGTIAHFGSTLLAVASHGHGSIVVVRDAGDGAPIRHRGPVVAGIDGGPAAEAVLAAAFAEAAERNAELVAVHCRSNRHLDELLRTAGSRGAELEMPEDAVLAERLAGWQEKYPDVSVIRKVSSFGPIEVLETWSKSAQLIVVGSRGRGGFVGLLLGSTSNFLIQHAQCPVLVAHSE